LKEAFQLKWRQVPTPSAIRKILVRLDPEEVGRVLSEMATHLQEGPCEHICLDGKTLRGSFNHTKNQNAARVFSAFAAHDKIVLARVPLESDKDHELAGFARLLKELNLEGVVITADALHCQKKTFN
jgi:hypothetical protein